MKPGQQGFPLPRDIQKLPNQNQTVGHFRRRNLECGKVLFENVRRQGNFRIEHGGCHPFQIQQQVVDERQKDRGLFRGEEAGRFKGDVNSLFPKRFQKGPKSSGMEKRFPPGKGDAAVGIAIQCGIFHEVLEDRVLFHGRRRRMHGAQRAGSGSGT